MSDTAATPASADDLRADVRRSDPDRFGPDFWHIALADTEWFTSVIGPQLIGALASCSTVRTLDAAYLAGDVLDRVELAVNQKRAKLPRSKR